MQRIYPQLGKYGKITIDSLENALKRCPSNHFDLVFTMAVLEHIHKDSECIFSEIKRITKKYIICTTKPRRSSLHPPKLTLAIIEVFWAEIIARRRQ